MIVAVAVFVVNVGYLFEGSFQRLGDFHFRSKALGGGGADSDETGNRFRSCILSQFPMPLPRNYVLGIDAIKEELEHREPSFAMFTWRDGGSWWYYLYGVGVKTPLGALVLISCGVYLAMRSSSLRTTDKLCLLLSPVAIFIFVSANTGINHHVRYVLPAIPFLYVAAGSCLSELRSVKSERLVIGLATWAAVSSVWVYPHSLSYFNELAGGPRNGHWHLLGSNMDWGQDDGLVTKWVRKQKDQDKVFVVLGQAKEPAWFGIENSLEPPPWIDVDKPTSDENQWLSPGLYVISVNALHGDSNQIVKLARQGSIAQLTGYEYFSNLPSPELLGYGYRVFRIDHPVHINVQHQSIR
jgi:hypothetical protein